MTQLTDTKIMYHYVILAKRRRVPWVEKFICAFTPVYSLTGCEALHSDPLYSTQKYVYILQ